MKIIIYYSRLPKMNPYSQPTPHYYKNLSTPNQSDDLGTLLSHVSVLGDADCSFELRSLLNDSSDYFVLKLK